jgi:ankyrin repeat protein
LEKIASLALDLDFSDVENILEHPTELNYFDLLSAAAQSSTPIVPADNPVNTVARAIEAAAQVAESYSIGFGADQDLLIARKWLAVSARAGRLDHAIYFSVVDDALGHSELHRPAMALQNLWLVLTASGGCAETSRILRDRHPDLYAVAKRIQIQSGGILRNVRDPEEVVGRIADRLEDKGLPIDHQFLPAGYTVLHFAVASGHEGAVEGILDEGANVNSLDLLGYTPLLLAASCGKGNLVKLLLQRNADPRIGHDLFKYTPLHFLSYVEDETVDSLAETMMRDTEQLNVVSSERGKVGLENPFQSLWGSPLHWAASKPNERLFARLLKLHQSFSTMPVDLNVVLDTLSSMHHYSMLDLLVPLVPKLRSSGYALNMSELDRLLLNCIRDASGMQHIMIHRGAFEEAKLRTLEVLLKAGANPFRLSAGQLNDPDNVLQVPVVADDLQALKRLVSFGEQHKVDLKAVFEDTARFSGRNAFQRSIYCSSWRVFEYFAQSPYIDLRYTSERGMTALHAAATNNDPRFIDVLLGLGCDPYARAADGRTPFQSAIFFKAFASASRLLQPDACTPERLFAATPEACNAAGFTLLGLVVSAALTNYRHAVNFTSIRYLESVGAFTFTNNILHHTTLLDPIAKQYSSIRPDYAAFDRALLEYLLSRAPAGVLNQHDEYGLTPLHWMVMRGNLPAITTVLTHPSSQSQIDVNVETLEARPTSLNAQPAKVRSNPGQTALNLAFLRRHQIPNFIKQGGQRELRQWGLRTEAIIEALQAAGAAMGSESSEHEQLEAMGANVVHPGDDLLGSLLVPVLGQRFRAESSSRSGAWPLRLGPNRGQSNKEIEDDTLADGNDERAEQNAGIEEDAEEGAR